MTTPAIRTETASRRHLVWLVVVAVLLLISGAIVGLFFAARSAGLFDKPPRTVPFAEFFEELQQGHLAKVIVTVDDPDYVLTGTVREPRQKSDAERIQTRVPGTALDRVGLQALQELAAENGTTFESPLVP